MTDVAVVRCRGSVDDWQVEAIDTESEGEIFVACFSGPGAHDRAREYAAWKYGLGGIRN